ncbi:MAG TPA: hypothetical protein VFM88_17825 [Vicinamibacteria bacterium]|nr:hypothetical protein [Vicinamibacteria bacterium]
MKAAATRFPWLGLAVFLGACNAHDAPQIPTAATRERAAAAAPASDLASASGGPAGFFASFRVEPQPGTDGVIRGSSPLPVEFDLCRSRADAGKPLYFLFDWNFDHVADVIGTGDTCLQTHTFNAKDSPDGTFEANVCLANGDPRAHSPNTYITCRSYEIRVTSFPQSNCEHSRCVQGGPLTSDCNNCVTAICAVDPYCCGAFGGFWDSICVGEVASVCGKSC